MGQWCLKATSSSVAQLVSVCILYATPEAAKQQKALMNSSRPLIHVGKRVSTNAAGLRLNRIEESRTQSYINSRTSREFRLQRDTFIKREEASSGTQGPEPPRAMQLSDTASQEVHEIR